MAPRQPATSRITDDMDVNLDDIDEIAGDPENQPDEDEPEDKPEPDESDEPGDQPEPEAPGPSDEPEADRTPRAARRGDRRLQALANENRTLRESLANINGRLDQLATPRPPAEPQETPHQRAERLALMSPDERAAEYIREDQVLRRREMASMQANFQEQADKSAFDAILRAKPGMRRYAQRVEQELEGLRRRGSNATREGILKYIIGQDIYDGQETRGSPGVRAAERRVRNATTRPGNNSSDVEATRRQRSRQTLEDRLADQPL